jgi:hypothetical protein
MIKQGSGFHHVTCAAFRLTMAWTACEMRLQCLFRGPRLSVRSPAPLTSDKGFFTLVPHRQH